MIDTLFREIIHIVECSIIIKLGEFNVPYGRWVTTIIPLNSKRVAYISSDPIQKNIYNTEIECSRLLRVYG